MLTITGHGWLAGTAVGLGILGLVFVASLSIVMPVFQFPPPTGPYAIDNSFLFPIKKIGQQPS